MRFKATKKCLATIICATVVVNGFSLFEAFETHAEVTEERTLTDSGVCRADTDKMCVYQNEWNITYTYTLTYTQQWNDELGEEVYTYESADIVEIYLELATCGAMEYPGDYDTSKWSLLPPPDCADISIPSEIEGVPVKSVSDIYCFHYVGGWCIPTSYNICIPESIENAGSISYMVDSDVYMGMYPEDFEIKLHYNGTCAQLFETGYSGETFECSDGTISTDSVTYNGTCAEWLSICPSKLADTIAYCSDGTVNAPLPTDDKYTFTREPASAVYIGSPSDECVALYIPSEKYGYPVTEIAANASSYKSNLRLVRIGSNVEKIDKEAFLSCKSLTEIYVPDSVTEIGDRAIGFWKNSDGTYSPMSKTVIHCVEGSAAHTYAVENGLTFSFSNGTEEFFAMGDINDDGEFSITDVVNLQKWTLAVTDATSEDWQVGDLCEDNKLDVCDLCAMKKVLLHS